MKRTFDSINNSNTEANVTPRIRKIVKLSDRASISTPPQPTPSELPPPEPTLYQRRTSVRCSPPIKLTREQVRELGIESVFVHSEGDTELTPNELSNLPISQTLYGKKELIPLIENLKGYVALPAYLSKGEFHDFQLAVTGSPQKGESEGDEDESITSAAIREIKEEIGITIPDSLDPIDTLNFNSEKKMVNAFVYKPQSIVRSEKEEKVSDDTIPKVDNSDKKIVSWVLLNDPDEIIIRQRITSKDKAGKKVVVMQIEDVVKLIKYLF